MKSLQSRPGLTLRELFAAGGNILRGRVPILSIEITRECPLSCPGCYAYGDQHLGDSVTLRQLADFRGDELVGGVLELVRQHRPLHVSLVGGEPLVRHRELSKILPALSAMGIFTMVVTSAVIPVPMEWMGLPRTRVAVSVDGLPEHHDERRKPATYDRILRNIEGRQVNIHWTITRPMLQRLSYLEEYVSFWDARPEAKRIWVSLYSPQQGEQSAEMLTYDDRRLVAEKLPGLRARYPKLLMSPGIAQSLLSPPANPAACLFSKLSTNYSADLKTRVEPCIFGGTPDCSQCGCAATSGLHYVEQIRILGGLRFGHLVRSSMAVGSFVNQFRAASAKPSRWAPGSRDPQQKPELVQIHPS